MAGAESQGRGQLYRERKGRKPQRRLGLQLELVSGGRCPLCGEGLGDGEALGQELWGVKAKMSACLP